MFFEKLAGFFSKEKLQFSQNRLKRNVTVKRLSIDSIS